MGISVDANVINKFLKCLIADSLDVDVYRLIDCIKRGDGFSIDVDGRIKHQWSEACRHHLFDVWFEKGVQAGTIRAVDHQLDSNHKKHLRTTLGFPYSVRHEGTYIEIANVTLERIIVSEDIDFWSPKDKLAGAERHFKIKNGKKDGDVYRYLRNQLNIQVLTIAQALVELGCENYV